MKSLVPIISLLFIGGCTTSNAMLISKDEAILSVQSHNSLVGVDAVVTRTLNEAAKLTISRGYRYFEVYDVQDTTRKLSFFVPGSTYSSGNSNSFGNTTYYNSSSTYQPPRVVNGQWVGDRVRIKMFSDGSEHATDKGVYDATYIIVKR